jgi:hypothetical protein
MISGGLDQVLAMFMIDVENMTDEQLAEKKMGVGRSPIDMTAEVALFNAMCSKILSGGTAQYDPEAMGAAMAELDSREKACAALKENTDKLSGVIGGLSDEDLGAEITAPWGEPITKAGLANMCVGHMMYHDGQINFIQTLNGDNEVHWMKLKG